MLFMAAIKIICVRWYAVSNAEVAVHTSVRFQLLPQLPTNHIKTYLIVRARILTQEHKLIEATKQNDSVFRILCDRYFHRAIGKSW